MGRVLNSHRPRHAGGGGSGCAAQPGRRGHALDPTASLRPISPCSASSDARTSERAAAFEKKAEPRTALLAGGSLEPEASRLCRCSRYADVSKNILFTSGERPEIIGITMSIAVIVFFFEEGEHDDQTDEQVEQGLDDGAACSVCG